MTLVIKATKEIPVERIEGELHGTRDISVERKGDSLHIESEPWGARDRLQQLFAKIGIPAENMQTIDPPQTSFVVGRETISDAA